MRDTELVPSDDASDEVRDWLRRLARHLPAFQAPGFRFGSWVRSRQTDDGAIVMGWYEPGPAAEAFLADARAMMLTAIIRRAGVLAAGFDSAWGRQ